MGVATTAVGTVGRIGGSSFGAALLGGGLEIWQPGDLRLAAADGSSLPGFRVAPARASPPADTGNRPQRAAQCDRRSRRRFNRVGVGLHRARRACRRIRRRDADLPQARLGRASGLGSRAHFRVARRGDTGRRSAACPAEGDDGERHHRGPVAIMWSHSTGSEVMQRIAAPMIGGMITAPLLSMFVIPAAYRILRRREIARVATGPSAAGLWRL